MTSYTATCPDSAEAFGPAYYRAFQKLHALGQSIDRDDLAADNALLLSRMLEPTTEPGCLGHLGTYEIVEVLGQGGMGIVFRARDITLNRDVAIKILLPGLACDQSARERFAHEARTVAAINHDNVLSIYTVAESEGLPYLVMPYIAGRSLAEKIAREGQLRVSDVLRIGMQAALGLSAAHERGVVHRDIKPSNLLLEGVDERVKIADFGLATPLNNVQATHSGTLRGTPEFMSPEQARGGTVDERSDLFSLGALLYAMTAGESPFRAPTLLATLRRVCDETPPRITERNADVTAWLAAVIERLLAKNPGDRYQHAAEVAESLCQQISVWSQPRRLASGHTSNLFTTPVNPTAATVPLVALAATVRDLPVHALETPARHKWSGLFGVSGLLNAAEEKGRNLTRQHFELPERRPHHSLPRQNTPQGSDLLRQLLTAGDFDRAVQFASHMSSQERIEPRILPALDDACRRVACRQALEAAVDAGQLEGIERAYVPHRLADYPAAAPIVERARSLLAVARALDLVDVAATAGQWSEFQQLWRDHGQLLQPHTQAAQYQRLYESLDAVDRLEHMLNDPSSEEATIAREWATLHRDGEPPRAGDLRQAAVRRQQRQAYYQRTCELIARACETPTYAGDVEMRRTWKMARHLGETRLETQMAHYRAAKQRIRRMRCLNELTQSPTLLGEQHIAACLRYLPKDYHPKLPGRIQLARRRLDAVRAIETMAHGPASERAFLAAWSAVVAAKAQTLVTAACRERVALARERLALVDALRGLATLPVDQRDRRALELWHNTLLADCREAAEVWPLVDDARRRRLRLTELQTAIESDNATAVAHILANPLLADYPLPASLNDPLAAYRERARQECLARKQAILQAILDHDPNAFRERFDRELVAELCLQSPHHERVVAAWIEQEILPLDRCGLQPTPGVWQLPIANRREFRWIWPSHAITCQCQVTVSHNRPSRNAIPDDMDLLYSTVIERKSAEGEQAIIELPIVLAWHGAEVFVWAIVDLGFQTFYSEPLSLGLIRPPDQ